MRDDEFGESREIRRRNTEAKDERIRKRLEACVRYQSPVVISHLATAFRVTSDRIWRIAAEHNLERALADSGDRKSAHYHIKKSARGAGGDRFGGSI